MYAALTTKAVHLPRDCIPFFGATRKLRLTSARAWITPRACAAALQEKGRIPMTNASLVNRIQTPLGMKNESRIGIDSENKRDRTEEEDEEACFVAFDRECSQKRSDLSPLVFRTINQLRQLQSMDLDPTEI
ncbi:hypothetical protein [Pararhodobacter zhoushanensis]|uniref:Uncharacterized protein n=1 Tax=Pararhodobacter zhoushanensis TaxID=2479545 RepID=A0ABT3H381_9RHOB|nr:hypothetical protein [Pararhodobacter zhoushanensis]MCW1934140.1 hypothetical protein [Pararhodobacter zhoushanensis]